MRRYPVWTARCKSGYQFRNRQGKWRSCSRFTGRGEILCTECARAEVVPAEPGRLERFTAALRGFALMAKRPA